MTDTYCPNSDHDGSKVRASRRISATRSVEAAEGESAGIETARCDYCAEGYIALLLRDGWTVTISAVAS